MTAYKNIDLKELVQLDLPTVQKIMKETLDLTATQQIMRERGTFDVNSQLTVSGGMQGKNIYQIVVEQFSQGTRNTLTQIHYFEALEKAIGLFRTTALELRKEMDVLTLEQRLGALRQELKQVEVSVKKPEMSEEMTPAMKELTAEITDAVFFSNRYALSFAGYVGLGLLGMEKAPIENLFSFGTKYDQSKDRDDLTTRLTRVVSQDLLRVTADTKKSNQAVTDEEMKLTLQSIFTSWTNQFNWETFKDTAEKYAVEHVRLQYGTYSMIAGAGKRKHDVVTVDEKFMDVRKTEVIGSQELGERLWSNFLKLAAFDVERKKNPYDPASVIFTYGEPGGGKTFTAHAYVQSFADLCKEKGLAMWALTHSTTDYASHYQNKTANELSALAGKIKEFPGVVVMYVADADNIFLSRKNPQLTAEQQQTLGVYFKMFDGTMVPKNGKFLAVMDANYLEGIDDATKSRLFDEVVEVKRFDKVEDFAELARRTLTSGLGTVGVSDTEWKEIGEYLLPCPLSNREIGHVIKQLRRGFNVPQEMIGRSYDEHVAYRNQQLQGMTKETIIGKFEEYVARRMEIERASYEARRRDDTSRFMEFLARQGNDGNAGTQ